MGAAPAPVLLKQHAQPTREFFTPVLITLIAERYGLAGGISLAALFALLAGAWIWVFPETRGRVLDD